MWQPPNNGSVLGEMRNSKMYDGQTSISPAIVVLHFVWRSLCSDAYTRARNTAQGGTAYILEDPGWGALIEEVDEDRPSVGRPACH